jgi:POT family proton-dependent oligopeptide transporter
MRLGGVPNDVFSNLDLMSIIIIVSIMDSIVCLFLRKCGIRFTSIKKINAGFILGSFAMNDISVRAVNGVYAVVAMSKTFASVTTLEHAFTKAPESMRSLVQPIQLCTTADSAALTQAFTPVTNDLHLVWNYSTVAIVSFVTGIGPHFTYLPWTRTKTS